MAGYLLDTDTCIAVMRGHPLAVQRLAAVAPGDCVISTVTAHELYTGWKNVRSRLGSAAERNPTTCRPPQARLRPGH
jgi:predicted nucleic acid-binding protein